MDPKRKKKLKAIYNKMNEMLVRQKIISVFCSVSILVLIGFLLYCTYDMGFIHF